jgi:hypothetical protein
MNDDWRLRVEFHEDGVAHALSERLNAAEIEHDLEKSFADRVIVSVDGAEVFAYAGTREQAERAEQLIRKVAADHEWKLESELKHWHPTSETWEDPDLPLPQTDADRLAEHAALMERERSESEAQGYPEYEVRIQCRTHEETLALAEQLRANGLPAVHRWRYLLLGAVNEASADELALRVRELVPEDSTVTIEASLPALADGTPGNPFAILGGLGG